MEKALPKAIWSGEFELAGVSMKCHVLENGQRVIDEDSVVAFLEALATTTQTADDFEADVARFAAWMRGRES